MELKVEIGFDQLLYAIKQLPENQQDILKEELSKKSKIANSESDFQSLLLRGPVMNNEQYATYKEVRKQLNKWRTT